LSAMSRDSAPRRKVFACNDVVEASDPRPSEDMRVGMGG
jgi:hypothetical protein